MSITERRQITLRDVAAAAGVSKTTATFILNERPNFSVPEETRRRVRDAAAQLGYRRNGLAAALSRGRTGSIGIVIPTYTDTRSPALGDDFLLGILLCATDAAAAAGLRLTCIPYTLNCPPTPEEVTDQRVDGLILVAIRNEAFARAVYATGFPCVTLGSGYAERRITADNIGGARQAVEYLIQLGHRNIAYYGLGETEADIERRRGWRETLERHGLRADIAESDLATLLNRLQTDTPEDRPTAIFCHNDARASLLLQAVREAGWSVPTDLSVVGFDNGVVAQAGAFTTVSNPFREQVATAVDLLLRLGAGEQPDVPPPFPTELVIRRTTAPPRGCPLPLLSSPAILEESGL